MKSAEVSPVAPATLRTYLAFLVVLLGALRVTGCGSSSTPSPKPILSTSASTVNFGAVLLGSTSSQSLSLTNSGTVSLTISQASVSNSSFSISGITTPLTLSPNQAASAIVKFAPVQTGSVDGSISLTSNASNSPTLISLNGAGAAPMLQLSASPTTWSFGNVTVGNSATQTITLTNTGNSSLNITQVAASGLPFSTIEPLPPSTLSAGQSATLSIGFSPTSAGSFRGSVSVFSNATNSPTLITLTGNGVEGTHGATLLWTASTSLVAGYNLYRATEFGGSYTKLNAALITDTTYTDSTVQSGNTYYYVVTALDSANNESVYSNQVTAKVP